MSERCKHGLNPESCALCEGDLLDQPLPNDPLRLGSSGQAALVLRSLDKANRAKILGLDSDPPIAVVAANELRNLEYTDPRRREIIEALAARVAALGFLFSPDGPLTFREQTDVGPTHCFYDRRPLSVSMGALGCSQCKYYVCKCGRCLCGYTGKNYLGQLFSQLPPLPVAREDRVEYIRAFRYLKDTQGGQALI